MKKDKKTVVLTIIGITALLISVIGAAYAYFRVNTENNFGTPKVDASAAALGSVKLLSTDNNLYLNLTRKDMMSSNTGEYYAVTDEGGVASKTKNEVEIGTTEVTGKGTYNCNYKLNVTYTGDMKENLTKNGVLILNINGTDYDIYSTTFPLEIDGTFKNISSSVSEKIIASLRFNNLDEIQNEVVNKNVKLEIKAEEFNCVAVEDNSVYAKLIEDYENNNGVSLLSDSDKGSRDYDTYYYTGNITNNNVLYGDFCWKMVITTEGNGVKMIYNGKPSNGRCDNTGDDSTIGESAFNSSDDSPAYVGYMYNKVYAASYKVMLLNTTEYAYGNSVSWNGSNYTLVDKTSGAWSSVYNKLDSNHYTCFDTSETCTSVYYIHHAFSSEVYYLILTGGVNIEDALNEMLYADDVNTTDSTIKAKIDSWYESNLLTREDSEGNLYSSYLQNTIYCNNRETTSLGGFNPNGGSNTSDYEMYFNYNTLDCANKTDQFTLRVDAGGKEGYGNNALKYPIGLLTYKEVRLARNENNTNYLNNHDKYWLLSPSRYYYNSANGGYVNAGGNYYGHVDYSYGVRPAVTLSSSVEIKDGDGSVDSPYVVGLA